MSKYDKILEDILKNIWRYDMWNYEVVIRWSKENNCYIAKVPELPGCIADGESMEEVKSEIEKSISLWIEVNTKRGIEIPEPKGKSAYA